MHHAILDPTKLVSPDGWAKIQSHLTHIMWFLITLVGNYICQRNGKEDFKRKSNVCRWLQNIRTKELNRNVRRYQIWAQAYFSSYCLYYQFPKGIVPSPISRCQGIELGPSECKSCTILLGYEWWSCAWRVAIGHSPRKSEPRAKNSMNFRPCLLNLLK